MKRTVDKKIRRRTLILGFTCLLWFALLILRLVQLQLLEHAVHKETVHKQNQSIVEILPERGRILDRKGRLLAASTPARHIAYRPEEDESRHSFQEKMDQLKPLLPPPYTLSREDTNRIWQRVSKGYYYNYLKKNVPWEIAQKVQEAGLPGIEFEPCPKREYPLTTLAGRLVGWIDQNGKGQAGVEKSYNRILGGEAGLRLDLKDAYQRNFQTDILKQPVPGKTIFLTIDEIIQYFAFKSLKTALEKTQAKNGIVIVSQPATGEILAMAHAPWFDPNRGGNDTDKAFQNGAIHFALDPGSTMKIATFAAALESGLVNTDKIYDCSAGKRMFGLKAITDHKKLGLLSFPEVFIHSSNVGTTMIADEIGEYPLHLMHKAMGFGQRTGIDLPAEVNGKLEDPEGWSKYAYAYKSIGYELTASPLQVLQMANVVANRGLHIPLRVVKDIPDARASLPEQSTPYKRIIQPQTADYLNWLMREAVRLGTGVEAQIPGYEAAGKTGTARKVIDGGYSNKHHIASFVGFVPADDPVISIIVVIDEPQGQFYGGDVAAPVFRDIASLTLCYLRIPQNASQGGTLLTADSRRQRP
jgi:cell division protein FtsI/penicillin-binding protein 2